MDGLGIAGLLVSQEDPTGPCGTRIATPRSTGHRLQVCHSSTRMLQPLRCQSNHAAIGRDAGPPAAARRMRPSQPDRTRCRGMAARRPGSRSVRCLSGGTGGRGRAPEATRGDAQIGRRPGSPPWSPPLLPAKLRRMSREPKPSAPAAAPVLSVTGLRKSYGAQLAWTASRSRSSRGRSSPAGPQRRRQDDDHRHDPRRAGAGRGHDPHRGHRPRRPPLARAGAHRLRRRLRAPARQPHVAQNLRIFGMLYGVGDLARRTDEVLAEFALERFRDTRCGVLSSGEQARVALGQGHAQPAAPAAARRADRLARPGCGARAARAHPRLHHARPRWRAVDLAQHVRGRGGLRSRALPLAGRILLAGDPRTLPAEHGRATLEDLSSPWRASRCPSRGMSAMRPGRVAAVSCVSSTSSAAACRASSRCSSGWPSTSSCGASSRAISIRWRPPASTSCRSCSARCCAGTSSPGSCRA